MNTQALAGTIIIVAAFGTGIGLRIWFNDAPTLNLATRLTDFESEELAREIGEVVSMDGPVTHFSTAVEVESSNWPRFRGADYSNIVGSETLLADSWGAGGPPVVWSMPLSEGHAGVGVWKGLVYLLDYDEETEGDSLRCFSLATGEEHWRRGYKSPTKRNHGVSRTVPAITEDFIVTVGPNCHAMGVERKTGEYLWGIDMRVQYGTQVPLWYTGQCPVIYEDMAVLAPIGTDVLMAGIDCRTGETLWETPALPNWKMSHSSIITMNVMGKDTFVYCADGGVAGVSAEPEDRGTLLWHSPVWSHSVTSPSPVRIDDEHIFVTAGYGGGSMMLKLKDVGGKIEVEQKFELSRKVFGCEQQTPLFYQDHIFGILPQDAAALKGQFVCLNTDGEVVWSSGKPNRFGIGPFLAADDKFLLLDDNGTLTMLRASLTGYEQLAQHAVLKGHSAWAPMAMVDGKLILRDSKTLACLDLSRAAN